MGDHKEEKKWEVEVNLLEEEKEELKEDQDFWRKEVLLWSDELRKLNKEKGNEQIV